MNLSMQSGKKQATVAMQQCANLLSDRLISFEDFLAEVDLDVLHFFLVEGFSN